VVGFDIGCHEAFLMTN